MPNTENPKNHHAHQADNSKVVTIKESEYLELKESAQKANEYWDKMLRMQADLENNRKRTEKDRQDFIRFANEGIIVELLNILDDLERAVSLAESKQEDLPVFLKGVEMILAHLYDMLKNYGVKPIEAQGKIFDPNFHEALMQVDDDARPEHTIVEELQKGYLMNDRVIRTAKVKVSKKNTDKK
jgi:molecular chaperone GrpE